MQHCRFTKQVKIWVFQPHIYKFSYFIYLPASLPAITPTSTMSNGFRFFTKRKCVCLYIHEPVIMIDVVQCVMVKNDKVLMDSFIDE